MKKILFTCFLLFVIGGFSQSNDIVFQQANQAYQKENYAEALSLYQKLLVENSSAPTVHYNLGNTFYKLNQIAPSIYHYEMALLLNPSHKDARNNLFFAEKMRIDRFEEVPKSIFTKFNERFIYTISVNTWAWVSILFATLVVLFFFLYYFVKYNIKKRLYFLLSFLSLVSFIFVLSFAYKADHHDQNNKPAIVFSKKVSVKSEPIVSANENFALHEGTKVQILETLEGWSKIKISDGQIGWIGNEHVKELK